MKITTNGKWLLLVGVAMLCLVPCALAQTSTLLLTSYGDEYGPYYLTYFLSVNGGSSIQMIDDDLWDPPSSKPYPATANSFSNLGAVSWASGFYNNLSQSAAYEDALTLSYAILFNTQGTANLNNMLIAVLDIFQPNQTQNAYNGTVGNWANVTQWIGWASSNPFHLTSTQLAADFIIWTPNAAGCQGMDGGSPNCAGNEFIQYVGPEAGLPEGGAALLYLLLAGVSCFGAMFFRSRNRRATPRMA